MTNFLENIIAEQIELDLNPWNLEQNRWEFEPRQKPKKKM